MLKLQPTNPICLLTIHKEKEWLCHARFGHVNFYTLRDMSKKHMVHGLPLIDRIEQLCESCVAGKQHRLPFPSATTFRAQTPLELFHVDLCGPITSSTPGGKRYVLLHVDYCMRFMWIVILMSKDEALEAFKNVKNKAEMEIDLKLKTLRMDRGGEFNVALCACVTVCKDNEMK